MSTPPPSNVRHGGDEEMESMSTPPPFSARHEADEERGNKGAEQEERGKATKTVKTEAGDDGGSSGGKLINIKVTSQTADDVFFRVKRNVKLGRIMDMYCGKHSLHPKVVLFLGPEGRQIRRSQTPDEVGLEDGDEISIMLQQIGGAAAREPELSA